MTTQPQEMPFRRETIAMLRCLIRDVASCHGVELGGKSGGWLVVIDKDTWDEVQRLARVGGRGAKQRRNARRSAQRQKAEEAASAEDVKWQRFAE